MLKGIMVAVALAGAVACATRANAPADTESGHASLIQQLQHAEKIDRDNSTSFSRSAPSLDHFYQRKADEIASIIRRLQAGEEVPRDEIDHALDNSLASTFGVPAP